MIYIACALHCEAKPLVERYKLKLDREALYPLFFNEEMGLIVAGIGKQEMASAVSYLFAHCGEKRNAAWLNIGIAGHGFHSRGSLLNINKIVDAAMGKNWYPGRFASAPGFGCDLLSVDRPEQSYPESAAVDMEASAFMSIVQRYTLVDLIQVVKVVSDNSAQDIEAIDKHYVTELIAGQMSAIELIIGLLRKQHNEFAEIYDVKSNSEDFFKQWHFTQYQRNELEKLLEKAQALRYVVNVQDYAECLQAGQVMREVQKQLGALPIEF